MTTPDRSPSARLAPPTGNGDYKVNIAFHMPDDDRLRPLCETKWHQNSEGRSVFFVVQKEGGRIPRIVGLNDQRAATD